MQEVIDYINEKPEATWSPEQIACTPCELKRPSWRTIYRAYFADPYCAGQKGTNENFNGLLREFYLKGRKLSRVAPATLKQNLALINARPRKVLNFHSPQELWNSDLIPCCSYFDKSLLHLRLLTSCLFDINIRKECPYPLFEGRGDYRGRSWVNLRACRVPNDTCANITYLHIVCGPG